MMHTLKYLPAYCADGRALRRRKSRAIRVQPPTPGEEAALAAMLAARSQPRLLTDAECLAHHAFRARADIASYVTQERSRRGRVVYRRVGHRGADLPMFPVQWDALQAMAAFKALLTRTFRKAPPSVLGVKARQDKAQRRADNVLQWLDHYQHRERRQRAALIARKTGELIAYVRRVLRNVHDATR